MKIDISSAAVFLLALLNIANMIIVLTKTASAPGKERDAKMANELEEVKQENADIKKEVTEIKQKMQRYDKTIDRNLENINSVRKTMLHSTAIIIRGVKALQDHAIDGNNTKALQASSDEISKYIKERMDGKGSEYGWED